jgi:hypothetical protein
LNKRIGPPSAAVGGILPAAAESKTANTPMHAPTNFTADNSLEQKRKEHGFQTHENIIYLTNFESFFALRCIFSLKSNRPDHTQETL